MIVKRRTHLFAWLQVCNVHNSDLFKLLIVSQMLVSCCHLETVKRSIYYSASLLHQIGTFAVEDDNWDSDLQAPQHNTAPSTYDFGSNLITQIVIFCSLRSVSNRRLKATESRRNNSTDNTMLLLFHLYVHVKSIATAAADAPANDGKYCGHTQGAVSLAKITTASAM